MRLSFGIGLRRYDTIVADAREAEEQGFDFASIGEHVFFHGPIGNGLIALAAAAGATANIRLLSAITLVPLYPAALLAKQSKFAGQRVGIFLTGGNVDLDKIAALFEKP